MNEERQTDLLVFGTALVNEFLALGSAENALELGIPDQFLGYLCVECRQYFANPFAQRQDVEQ